MGLGARPHSVCSIASPPSHPPSPNRSKTHPKHGSLIFIQQNRPLLACLPLQKPKRKPTQQQQLHQAQSSATYPPPTEPKQAPIPPNQRLLHPNPTAKLPARGRDREAEARPRRNQPQPQDARKRRAVCVQCVSARQMDRVHIRRPFPTSSPVLPSFTAHRGHPTPPRCCCAWAACARCSARRRGASFRCARA